MKIILVIIIRWVTEHPLPSRKREFDATMVHVGDLISHSIRYDSKHEAQYIQVQEECSVSDELFLISRPER